VKLDEAYKLAQVERSLDGKKDYDLDKYFVYRWETKDLVIWFDGNEFISATGGGLLTHREVPEAYYSGKHDWRIWNNLDEYEAGRSNKSQ
jgi:hypothetical protein